MRANSPEREDDGLDHQIIAGDADGDGIADFETEVGVMFSARPTRDSGIIL